MIAYLLALLIGVVAGLRGMMPLAAVSLGAYLGWLHLEGTWLAFLGYSWTPWVLMLAALGELVTDKLPATPSRKLPITFGARIVTGALSGAAIGTTGGSLVAGAIAGAIGAVIGTLGGHAARARLAATIGKDRPAAFIEDVSAIVGALLIVVLAASVH
jgi:uncharacterized membrane protein